MIAAIRLASAVQAPQFYEGDLVRWNGHPGKVAAVLTGDKVSVKFGPNRFRIVPVADVSPFVPWYAGRIDE